jgi:hypothetical protein
LIKILYFIVPLIAILVAIFTILFTPFGSNKVLKPVANSYINKKIKEPKIDITKLDSKFGYIDIAAKSSNGIDVNAKGDIGYLNSKFGLKYNIFANSVKLDNRDIKVDLNVSGQSVGSIKNLGINGEGVAFGSNVKYKFILKDKNPQSIEASINSAQIAKIFAILNKAALVDGLFSLNANMPSLDIKNPKGRADIDIKDGRFNHSLIAKEFKIKLPTDEKYNASIKAAVKGKYIVGLGDINTTSAKLKIKKLTSSLDFKQTKGYYQLNIPNLSRLNKLANINLSGSLVANGVFYANLAKNIYQVVATTKSLNGVAKLSYSGNSAKATLKDISVVKILNMLSMQNYVTSGSINGIVDVKNIKHLNGGFNIATKGVLNKKLLNVKLPSYGYNVKAKGQLQNGNLSVKAANIVTNFVNLSLQNVKYSLITSALKGAFVANVDNLRALEMFTKVKLNGKVKAHGNFEVINKDVKLSVKTKSLGGALDLKYNKNRAAGSFSDLSLPKVLYMLNLPKYLLKANATGNFKVIDINNLDGAFNIKSLGSVDTKTIKKLYNTNLGERFKYSMIIKNGVLKNGRILTKPKANTSFGAIAFDYLNYDTKRSSLSGKYKIEIDNLNRLKPIAGQSLNGALTLTGTIKQNPSQLLITGVANEFGGVINFMLDNPKLKLEAAGLSVVRVLKMLNYEQVLDGVAKANLKYNLNSKLGNFKLNLDEARFLNSKLVESLKQYANFDLSKEVFSNAILDGDINKNIITFNLDSKSQRVKIYIKNAKIDTKAQTIDARVKITQKNQDYNFRVSGPIKDPNIKFIFAGYVKEKVKKKVLKELKKRGLDKQINKEIKKIIPKEIKALKDDNKTKEQIKKIIPKEVKGLFDKLF